MSVDEREPATPSTYSPSPRPTFDGPAHIPCRDVTRHLWGDDQSGRVADWIYASTDKIHQLVFGLAPGGRFEHSDGFRTVFAADQVFLVLTGRIAFSNPETGEVHVVDQGEVACFSRDTWHHGFNCSSEPLRVLEFFAPPPSQGTSGAYARTRPLLEETKRRQDEWIGSWPASKEKATDAFTMRVVRDADVLWRLEGGADGDAVLTGLWVSTEHITVGSTRVLPGQRSSRLAHAGDKGLYLRSGTLWVGAHGEAGLQWHELVEGDGFYVPEGVAHHYHNVSDEPADVVFGVAPSYLRNDG